MFSISLISIQVTCLEAASPTDEPVSGETRGKASFLKSLDDDVTDENTILEVYGMSEGDDSGSDDSEP